MPVAADAGQAGDALGVDHPQQVAPLAVGGGEQAVRLAGPHRLALDLRQVLEVDPPLQQPEGVAPDLPFRL
jgi:hypothetical protein